MGLKQPELGKRTLARRRVGIDFAEFDGMYLDADPGAIPISGFRLLENVDFIGELASRQGMRNQNEDPFLSDSACITIGADYQAEPLRLYIVCRGCPGVSTTVGRSIGFFDPDFSASFQRALYYDWSTDSAVLAPYGSDLFIGINNYLRRVVRVQTPVGVEPITVTGIRQDINIGFFPGYEIKALCEFDGLLFIAAENIVTPTSSIIYTYDGLVIREDRTGVVCPTTMIAYQETLVMGYDDNAINKITVRSLAGVYTDVTPTGTSNPMASYRMVDHQTNLYIADGADSLWKYDGATLTLFHTVATATFFNSVESFNGFLYYGYSLQPGTDVIAHIGRWIEASVFQDDHHNLTAQDATVHTIDVLKGYRNRLFAAARVDASTSKLYASADLDTGAAYSLITAPAFIYDLVEF